MKNLLALLFAIISLTGCHEHDTVAPAVVSEADCLDDHFYYYQNAPYRIDTLLRQDYMIVGFDTAMADAAIMSFMNSRPEFLPINTGNIKKNPLDPNKIVLVKFSGLKTCTQINGIRTNLRQANEVVLANYTYKTEAYLGGQTFEIRSYTDRFVVRVHDAANLTALDSLTSLHNMVATQNQFDSTIFLVLVPKSWPSDALQAANKFHETGLFQWSEPTFAYFQEY